MRRVSNPDVDTNTQLALQRTFLASERTLMAWIRTSLSMIGFGFSLAKLFQTLAQARVLVKGSVGRVWTAEGLGLYVGRCSPYWRYPGWSR